MFAVLVCCARAGFEPRVTVAQGTLEGRRSLLHGVDSFKGVPFAAPPLGELRFLPPQPPKNWTGVYQATDFGHDCLQW